MNYDQFNELVEASKAELEAYRAAQEQQTPTAVDQTSNGHLQATKLIEQGALRIIKGNEKYDAQGKSVH